MVIKMLLVNDAVYVLIYYVILLVVLCVDFWTWPFLS
jgi:hypothetical protein